MEPLAQVRSWLASTPFFGGLDAGGTARLAAAARRRRLARGETLWRLGEKPDAVAVVVSGSLHVIRTSERGDTLLLRILRPFEVVGLSTVAGAAHSADLVAGESSAVLTLPGRVLRELFAERPALALAAMARLGELLAALTTERSCDLDQRLLACLRRHARTRRELYLTHAELAAQVGASRANVSRALARLRRRGAVQCGRRRITLIDLGAREPEEEGIASHEERRRNAPEKACKPGSVPRVSGRRSFL
jgi:CRP-like cAMP-binding protein